MPPPLEPVDPQPVPFRTRIGDLKTPVVLECEGVDPIVVLEFDRRTAHQLRVRISTMDTPDPTFVNDVPLDLELGDVAVTELSERPLRAFSLPEGRLKTRHKPADGWLGRRHLT